MHVTEVDLIEQRAQGKKRRLHHTPIRYLTAIRSTLSHLLPYSATHTYTPAYTMDYDNAKRLKSSSGSPVSVKRTGATALPQYQPPPAR